MNDDGDQQRPPEQPSGTTYRNALLFTAGPIWVLSALSVAGYFAVALYWVWPIAAVYSFVALLVGIGYAASSGPREKAVGNGVLSGVLLGILGLGVTCYANVATMGGAL